MSTAPALSPAELSALNEILAPACKALYGGTPDLLATAIELSARLRGSYQRAAAKGMWAARRSGDVAAVRTAAAFAIEIANGQLPGLVTA